VIDACQQYEARQMIGLAKRITAARSHTLRLSVIFVACWIAIFTAVMVFGWTATWSHLGVPTLSPRFADMRTVQAGLDAAREGFNPQQHNPSDPWGRLMNYPSIWLTLGSIFRLQNGQNYLLFELSIVFLYLSSCFLLILALTRRGCWCWHFLERRCWLLRGAITIY